MTRRFSEVVESALSSYRAEYRQVVNGWIEEGTFGIAYPALLVETFHYVKHSVSLMSRACARLDHSQLRLQRYLAKHIAEEVGHEEWILDDLEHLGFRRNEIEASPPLPETINLIGSQLYVIDYLHPAGLIGYIYVMESQPPSNASLSFLQDQFDIPVQAMSFLTRHGEADVEHCGELRSLLDTCFEELRIREAALVSALHGFANLNVLLARVRSGDYVSWCPRAMSRGGNEFAEHAPERVAKFLTS